MGRDPLCGRVALVMGACQGLRATIARECAAEGAVVGLLERDSQILVVDGGLTSTF